jgi:hypothetical protein
MCRPCAEDVRKDLIYQVEKGVSRGDLLGTAPESS